MKSQTVENRGRSVSLNDYVYENTFNSCIACQLSHAAQVIISLLLGDKLNSGNIEFGLDGGVNYPSIRGLEGGDARSAFNIGFYFDIKLKDSAWMVHTGVLVKSSLGESNLPLYSLGNPDLDNSFAEGQVKKKINYFNVSIMMKYKFNKRIYAEAGIMPSLRAKAYDMVVFAAESNILASIKKQITIEIGTAQPFLISPEY